MVADPEVLAEFKKLDSEKTSLESEIKELQAYLTEDGMPGLSGGLIDEEGFPRGDIDIYAIRKARNRLACAQTDHVAVMKKIEKTIEALHSGSRVSVPRSAPAAAGPLAAGDLPEVDGGSGPLQVELPPPPFALIDEVSAGSPAEAAGLLPGDQVCRFGSVSRTDTGDLNACFAAIPPLVQGSVGQSFEVVVVRGEPPARTVLRLAPQRWEGRGLLGCHMKPKVD